MKENILDGQFRKNFENGENFRKVSKSVNSEHSKCSRLSLSKEFFVKIDSVQKFQKFLRTQNKMMNLTTLAQKFQEMEREKPVTLEFVTQVLEAKTIKARDINRYNIYHRSNYKTPIY